MRASNLVTAILAASLLGACAKEEAPMPDRVRAVKTIVVADQASGQTRKYAGTVEPVDKSSLSFEVSGLIQSIAVNPGDTIHKGDVLAVLDKQPFELNVESAKAELSRSRAQLEEAQAAYERQRRIQERDPGATSEKAIDEARAAYESKREAINYGQAQLDLARRNLEKTELVAPFNGTISERYVEPYEEAQRGKTVLAAFMEGAMEVTVSVPENMISGVHAGLAGKVHLPNRPDHTYQAVVTEVGSIAASANAFTVKANIQDIDAEVKPGMTAELSLLFESDDMQAAYLLPVHAISPGAGDDERSVFKFDAASSTVKKIQVTTHGLIADQVAVTDGIAPGDVIVVAGVSFLRDGQKVKLLQPTQSGS